MPRGTAGNVLVAVLVAVVVGVLAGSLLGQPLGLGAVDSGNMAPTMQPGDGYVVVPAGDVEAGDVVVYWSAVDGEYVTSRVVGVEDGEYVTSGDANATTDQASGRPPVPRSAVVAKVFAVGGTPLVIPGLGTVVRAVQENPLPVAGLLGLVAIGFVVRLRAGRRARRPGATVLRVGDVVEPILLVGLLLAVVLTPLGTASVQVTYGASEGAGGQQSIPVDESVTRTVSIPARDTPITRHVVRADGMTVVDRSAEEGTIEVTASIPARGVAGPRPLAVHAHPYLDVLPAPVVEWLHDVHPVAAIAGTSGTVFGVLYLLYRLLLDANRPLLRVRSHWAKLLGGT